jgi:CheY-like chemotaxis protein
MQDRNLQFDVELDPEPLLVFGDSDRLQQIQINLLSNAVKYTPRGGAVGLRVARDGDGSAVIRVSDNGDGIPSQMLESVFDLFVQAKHTLDHSEGGLGVGLTLVRALVELHGGTVAVHSDGDGMGSEFTVCVPLASDSEATQQEDPAPMTLPPEGTTVVVVEDSADSREMLCTMLAHAGVTCHSAGDGNSGLTLVDEVLPDVVILDVGLPGMDGLEVARRIRSNQRHRAVRLIALTGYGLESDRLATKEAGFDYHLVKPVQLEELLTVLARLSTSNLSDRDTATLSPQVASEGSV